MAKATICFNRRSLHVSPSPSASHLQELIKNTRITFKSLSRSMSTATTPSPHLELCKIKCYSIMGEGEGTYFDIKGNGNGDDGEDDR